MVLAALKNLTDKPVRYVIDTHCHGDHTGGNASFQREGATIIAQRNVRERLATDPNCGRGLTAGLPSVTFSSDLTLYFDDEEVRITKLPTGHTDGDVAVYFRNANVLETGDAFVSSQLPAHSRANGGVITGVIDELKVIETLAPEDAKVIPGHGPPASLADVRAAQKALEDMRDAIQRQIHSGRSLTEIRSMDVLVPWHRYFGSPCDPMKSCDHLDGDFYLRSFFDALTATKSP
jgi:glyoxylase-like metal-dependent hydrolase (beta-lactamase superfamily II)